jgi:hypothetical protein
MTAAMGLKACSIEVIANSRTPVMMEAKTTIVPIANILWLTSPSPASITAYELI